MRPDVGPTACLSFEPDEARRLLWLPLAVRHKLDGCGLRLSLLEWQALPLDTRAELLHLPAGADFALCALHAGASRDTRLRQPVRLEAYEVAQALDCGQVLLDLPVPPARAGAGNRHVNRCGGQAQGGVQKHLSPARLFAHGGGACCCTTSTTGRLCRTFGGDIAQLPANAAPSKWNG